MIQLPVGEAAQILEVYLVANTPSYLLRHLRSVPAVEKLAKTLPAQGLLAAIQEVNDMPQRRPLDVAMAYAATAALTLVDPPPTEEAFAQLATGNLRWVRQMLGVWEQTRIGYTTVNIKVPEVNSPRKLLTASSSTTTIRVTGG